MAFFLERVQRHKTVMERTGGKILKCQPFFRRPVGQRFVCRQPDGAFQRKDFFRAEHVGKHAPIVSCAGATVQNPTHGCVEGTVVNRFDEVIGGTRYLFPHLVERRVSARDHDDGDGYVHLLT